MTFRPTFCSTPSSRSEACDLGIVSKTFLCETRPSHHVRGSPPGRRWQYARRRGAESAGWARPPFSDTPSVSLPRPPQRCRWESELAGTGSICACSCLQGVELVREQRCMSLVQCLAGVVG